MAFSFTPDMDNVYSIGSFDAKTYFSELLRRVQGGAVFNISKNGKNVAVLRGVKTVKNEAAFSAHKRILECGKKMAEMRNKKGLSAMTVKEIKELKDAGRKF